VRFRRFYLNRPLFRRPSEAHGRRYDQRCRYRSYTRLHPPGSQTLRSCALLPKFRQQILLDRHRRNPLAVFLHDGCHNPAQSLLVRQPASAPRASVPMRGGFTLRGGFH